MNTLLLPPLLQLPYQFRLHTNCRHQILGQHSSSSHLSISKQFNIEEEEDEEYDVGSYPNQRYDFTPLLQFLSTTEPNSENSSPTQLDPTELRLAEYYRVVPAPLWHSLLKSLSSTPSSISIAYALVTWLQKHNVCFSYELLYSILIHALGRSEKLYEAFLLSQRQTLTPLTYNALIGACARNGDLEKALNLMCRMRRDGYQSDYVNYSLIIQSLIRSNSIDLTMLDKFCYEIEADMIELDGQLLNDMIVGFAKAGDVDRALAFMSVVQGNGLSPKTATVVNLISELGNSGRTEEAEAIFEELKEGRLKPRTRAFNALFKRVC